MVILLISMAGNFVLLATLGMFFLLSTRQNLTEYYGLKARLESVRNFSLRHQDYDAFFNKLSVRHDALTVAIPEKVDLNNLVLEINNLANMYRVELQNLSLPGELNRKKQKGFLAQNMQITALGQCELLLEFMGAVEKMDNRMLFHGVQLEARDKDMVLLNGTIKVFSR